MTLIDSLKWRYATKQFDTSKKVSASDLEKIKEAVQLSASSFGFQFYKVLIVENPEIREKLKPLSWEQPQITDASHLLVFCNYVNPTNEHVDAFLELKTKVQGLPEEVIKGYGDMAKGFLANLSGDAMLAWTAKQTYLALGNLLAACGDLKIDSCPMEGFDAEQYNEVLGLKEKGLNASVLAAIGYRSAEDQTQNLSKVRRPLEDLFETV